MNQAISFFQASGRDRCSGAAGSGHLNGRSPGLLVKLPFVFEADLTVRTEWNRDQGR
ncbi:hypothetical protein M728_005303 (plasmid) [Ensifer sp. WSM1721]